MPGVNLNIKGGYMSGKLFELKPDKIEIVLVSMRNKAKLRLVHELRAPTQEDWIRYDRALNVAVQDVKIDDETGIKIKDNSIRAKCDLWDRLAIGVRGYWPQEAVTTDWKLIPPGHKQAVVECLLGVVPADSESLEDHAFYFDAGEEIIVLSAIREDHYAHLAHHFKSPSAGQRMEYQRVHADSIIVKGMSGIGDKVLLPSRMKAVCALYDALITDVEGYAVMGSEIHDPKEIAKWMDAQHKSTAIKSLFGSELVMQEPKRVATSEQGSAGAEGVDQQGAA
jgi:hypothetical protein